VQRRRLSSQTQFQAVLKPVGEDAALFGVLGLVEAERQRWNKNRAEEEGLPGRPRFVIPVTLVVGPNGVLKWEEVAGLYTQIAELPAGLKRREKIAPPPGIASQCHAFRVPPAEALPRGPSLRGSHLRDP
jgi:hypothetical protein